VFLNNHVVLSANDLSGCSVSSKRYSIPLEIFSASTP
jgi:hypothetical protein